MNRHPLCLQGIIAWMIAISASFAQGRADVIYHQDSNIGSGGFSISENAYTSSATNSFGSYTTYDDFSLSQGAIIDTITWQGRYSNSTFTGDATPNTTSWTIAIYTSSAGEPLITTLPLSGQPFTQVGSAFTGSATQTGSLVSNGHTYYSESAVLNDPITLQAGVTYYLKIFSNGDPSTGSWGWASDGNGYSYQYSSSTDLTTSVNDQNRTFALYGTPVVPEPSGLALSAIGGAGLLGGWLTRRRRRSAA